MIVSKTPLRVSFFGGGTDLPECFMHQQGAVLSTTIDTSMYICVNKSANSRIKAAYGDVEVVESVNDLKHDRMREALKHFSVNSFLDISSFCDIPTKGTGLGSSSTFTVGLITAILKHKNISLTLHEVAEIAYFIEREKCGHILGKQDQYAAAIGGLNLIKFEGREVETIPVSISQSSLNDLQSNLFFYYTGHVRSADELLRKQASNSNQDNYKVLTELALTGYNLLKNKKIDDFGALLDENWKIKKQLDASVSSNELDTMYRLGIENGALGGKLLGAGGGGFMMFYVPKVNHTKFKTVFNNFNQFEFKLSKEGTKIVYAD